MDTAILEDLGLSKGEIKVYLTLLELGSTKVGEVIEKSNMASSAVHNDINTLVNKGLVSYIKKGKIKFYQSVPPKNLVSFIEDKKKRLLEIIPDLEFKENKSRDKQDAEIFEGVKGVLSLLNILIEETRRGDEFLFFATYLKESNEEIQEFFRKYDLKRKDRGLLVKGLAPNELKPLFDSRKVLHMKYPKCPIPFDISMCNNKVALISWGEKPVGYLLKSKQMAEMYKEYFEKIWKIS